MAEKQKSNFGDFIQVESYTRADGTDVKAHTRHKPGRWHFENNRFQKERPNNFAFQNPDFNNYLLKGGVTWNDIKEGILPDPDKMYADQYSENTLNDPFKRNLGDKIQENLYLNVIGNFHKENEKSPTAFLNNAINDFDDARNNPNATIYNSGNEIPDAGLRKFITEDVNITDKGKINVKNMQGAYYNADSNVSKSIAHDPAVAQYVQKEYGNLLYNGKKVEEYQKNIPKGGEKWFKSKFIAKGNVKLTNLENFGDIGNCTLYNPHIDKNGHFKAQVIDIVDYENQAKSNSSRPQNQLLHMANQWGYKMQNTGMIKNIFHIVDIDVPVDELK